MRHMRLPPRTAARHGHRAASRAFRGRLQRLGRRRFCSDDHRRRGQKSERIIENSDYADGLNRQIRKMGARASGDLDALGWLAGAVEYAREALAMAVDGCRARGYSDGEIGIALGITRQAVGQRFGRKRDVHTGTAESGVAG
jgi:hypothetical protein